MVTSNSNLLCSEVEPYYYDFLNSESRRLVPESIIDHIKQCQYCQEQIEELKEVLSQAGLESEQKQIRTAVTDMLELHLAYIGKRVTCHITRPFLPSLLDPALTKNDRKYSTACLKMAEYRSFLANRSRQLTFLIIVSHTDLTRRTTSMQNSARRLPRICEVAQRVLPKCKSFIKPSAQLMSSLNPGP